MIVSVSGRYSTAVFGTAIAYSFADCALPPDNVSYFIFSHPVLRGDNSCETQGHVDILHGLQKILIKIRAKNTIF